MRVLAKYLLLQLPGWTAAGLILGWLHGSLGLPAWAAAGLFLANVTKDLVLYRYLRPAYADDPSRLVGPELLIGAAGRAEEDLAPSGFVRVKGERWRAALPQGTTVARGEPVVVRAVRGLVIEVEPRPPGVQRSADT